MFLAALLSIVMLQASPGDSVLAKIGVDQRLGAAIDSSVSFRDENGRSVKLSDFLGKKPLILTPVYFGCPMLCGMQLNDLVGALKVMPFTPGKEFEIVSFSFDPNEGADLARAKKEYYIRNYGRPEAAAGWHFLTGDAAAIQKLTNSIGFHYTYDKANDQWAHASTLLVVTPAGRISQYFNGIDYDPGSLKYSLIEASEERLGSILDRVLLFCYQFDAHSGRYSLAIMRVLRLLGAATVLGIVALWFTTRKL